MTALDIPLPLIARLSTDARRRVFRAFDCFIAAGPGRLLLVPLTLVSGDLRSVVDHCPVPYDELLALRDSPLANAKALTVRYMADHLPSLALITPYGWSLDSITPFTGGVQRAHRYSHPSGMRYAEI